MRPLCWGMVHSVGAWPMRPLSGRPCFVRACNCEAKELRASRRSMQRAYNRRARLARQQALLLPRRPNGRLVPDDRGRWRANRPRWQVASWRAELAKAGEASGGDPGRGPGDRWTCPRPAKRREKGATVHRGPATLRALMVERPRGRQAGEQESGWGRQL